MAVAAHFECSSASGLLPGSRAQESGLTACQAGGGNGSRSTLRVVSQLIRSSRGSSMISFNDRHPFGNLLEKLSAFHKRQEYRTEVWVAADYPDSKPDASSYLGDLGYHPLEDISSFEKKKNIEHTERRLTDAEVARTLAEVNQDAILFASLAEDEDHIFGTEVQYLVDERGDFYFQIDDDSEFLATLNSAGTQMNVAIGYESIEDWVLEQQEVHEENAPEDAKDDDTDADEDEQGEGWAIFTAEGTELILEELDEESSESIGDWSGLDTLQSVHPLDFADALSAAALDNDDEKIEKPSQSLRIVGEVCRLNDEEEEYVQRLFQDQFSGEKEDDDDSEQLTEKVEGTITGQQADSSLSRTSTLSGLTEPSSKTSISSMQNSSMPSEEVNGSASSSSNISRKSMLWPSDAGIGDSDDYIVVEFTMPTDTGVAENTEEAAEFMEVGTSFYKLDIQSIHVVSIFRAQSAVDRLEFQSAKPDVLARAGPAIIERLNSRGKVLEDALKLLCLHQKGLEVEEAALLQLDSLGMDLRVHCGREVQTVRISFSQRATTEEHAEQLLNQLLFPQIPLRGRRKRRPWSQGKSS